MLPGGVDVREDVDGVQHAPYETGEEEGGDEDDAVEPLVVCAGQVQLVEEPVDVEEGGRELVEDEDGAVVVDKGALDKPRRVSIFMLLAKEWNCGQDVRSRE